MVTRGVLGFYAYAPLSYSFDGAIDAPKEGFDVEHE
jgi:hypothetical protein